MILPSVCVHGIRRKQRHWRGSSGVQSNWTAVVSALALSQEAEVGTAWDMKLPH